ncbi:MAG: response regulator [Sedimenticola sp.]
MDEKGIQSILIVDDEPVNISILAELLQSHYQVFAANSGQNALLLLNEIHPDLILLDVVMPEMDGYSLLKELQRIPRICETPVIFVTALTDETDEQYGFSIGAVDYITKPFNSATVLARVAVHLELKAARDRLRDQNAWLETEVKKRMHENNLIQDVTLNALAQLAETRDYETGHHILRTQIYVEVLAQQLASSGVYSDQLSDKQQKLIVKAAPLHDIGKVGIPDSILLKRSQLTLHEFDVMKGHAMIGAQTIEQAIDKAMVLYNNSEHGMSPDSLAFLKTARDIALSHHERWDGKGYPLGLIAESTPLCARLMAIADVYDAMTSKRVYKEAMHHEEVEQYLIAGSGTQFDPYVVKAFIEIKAEFANIRRRFAEPEES